MRPTGHIIDAAGDAARVAQRPIAGMLAPSVPVPDVIDWQNVTSVVLDQMRSEGCVWHAIAMALYLRGKVEEARGIGEAIPMPSVMQGWILAQWGMCARLGLIGEERVARNQGSNVSVGLDELRLFGVVSAARWPLDERLDWSAPEPPEDTVFDMPLDVDVAASVAKLTGDYGANGADFPTVARAALAQGHFPVQAFDVCDEFFGLNPTNPVYYGTQGRPHRGRHMMVVDGAKSGFLRFRGSYGPGWGDAGWIWVSDEYCASSQARDGAVITASPKVKS